MLTGIDFIGPIEEPDRSISTLPQDERDMIEKILGEPDKYSFDNWRKIITTPRELGQYAPEGDIWFIQQTDIWFNEDGIQQTKQYEICRMPALIFAVYISDYFTAEKLLKSRKYSRFSEMKSAKVFMLKENENEILIYGQTEYPDLFGFIIDGYKKVKRPISTEACFNLLKAYDRTCEEGWFREYPELPSVKCEEDMTDDLPFPPVPLRKAAGIWDTKVVYMLCYIKNKDINLYRRIMSAELYAHYFVWWCLEERENMFSGNSGMIKDLYLPEYAVEEKVWERSVSFLRDSVLGKRWIIDTEVNEKKSLAYYWHEITGRKLYFDLGKVNLEEVKGKFTKIVGFGAGNQTEIVLFDGNKIMGQLMMFIAQNCDGVIYPPGDNNIHFDFEELIKTGTEELILKALKKDIIRETEANDAIDVVRKIRKISLVPMFILKANGQWPAIA